MKVIILAGGKGSRLWPLSKDSLPKQFLTFGSKSSLLQNTIARFLTIVSTSDLVIVTHEMYRSLVEMQCKIFEGKINIVYEKESRSTAPALCLALRYLEQECLLTPEEKVLLSPSDSFFEDPELFISTICNILPTATLTVFGAIPSRAETGYGYIEKGAAKNKNLFFVEKFIEKPTQEEANHLLLDPNVYWNIGHLLFDPSLFWRELGTYCPSLLSLKEMKYQEIEKIFDQLPVCSLDKILLENSHEIELAVAPCFWADVGSWDGVYEAFKHQQIENVKIGNVVDRESKNCLFIAENRKISAVGLENLMVVETEEVVFISKRKLGDVKQMILEENSKYRVEKKILAPGEILMCSNHFYQNKRWIVLQGQGRTLGQTPEGDIPQGIEHAVENIGDKPLEMIEVLWF